jgi:hypothetical protein
MYQEFYCRYSVGCNNCHENIDGPLVRLRDDSYNDEMLALPSFKKVAGPYSRLRGVFLTKYFNPRTMLGINVTQIYQIYLKDGSKYLKHRLFQPKLQ